MSQRRISVSTVSIEINIDKIHIPRLRVCVWFYINFPALPVVAGARGSVCPASVHAVSIRVKCEAS